jgi:hypothetical protein
MLVSLARFGSELGVTGCVGSQLAGKLCFSIVKHSLKQREAGATGNCMSGPSTLYSLNWFYSAMNVKKR